MLRLDCFDMISVLPGIFCQKSCVQSRELICSYFPESLTLLLIGRQICILSDAACLGHHNFRQFVRNAKILFVHFILTLDTVKIYD